MRQDRLSRLARAGILVTTAALVACTRWEVVDDFAPDCAPPQPPSRFDTLGTTPGLTLGGHVVSTGGGESVAYAMLYLRPVGPEDATWTQTRTDSVGRFEVRLASPGLWVVRTLHIAFWSRTDTLMVAEDPAPHVVLPLARPLCDPDFGIAVVQRKPWWKLW